MKKKKSSLGKTSEKTAKAKAHHKTEGSEVILDLGMIRNIKKSRVYAVLNGLVDAGVKIKYKKEDLPNEKRIKGEHLKNKINFEKIKESILKGKK